MFHALVWVKQRLQPGTTDILSDTKKHQPHIKFYLFPYIKHTSIYLVSWHHYVVFMLLQWLKTEMTGHWVNWTICDRQRKEGSSKDNHLKGKSCASYNVQIHTMCTTKLVQYILQYGFSYIQPKPWGLET